MRDSFGRTIDYLRISVTDRCNFRCVYCMPEEGYPLTPRAEILSYEEIALIVRVAARMGVSKVRLTGGEPLARKELSSLIEMIAATPGIRDLSMTTNGFLLARHADDLRRAGLQRVNISLDTLDSTTFLEIARRGSLDAVMAGIDAARRVGLEPLKLNIVAMRGINDHEAPEFARWTLREPVHIRFIELMPIKWHLDETDAPSMAVASAFAHRQEKGFVQLFELKHSTQSTMLDSAQMRRLYVSSADLQKRIEDELGPMEPADVITNGPARTFRLPGATGTIGFISQVSRDLCERCNRLRLTADGFLRPCLMADGEVNLRDPLRSGGGEAVVEELFEQVVRHKPERHYLAEGQVVAARGMSQLGG